LPADRRVPPGLRALCSASSFTTAPLPTLTRTAPFGSKSNSTLEMRPSVSLVAGRHTMRTLARGSSLCMWCAGYTSVPSAVFTTSFPVPRVAITRMPRAFIATATLRPTWPYPRMRHVFPAKARVPCEHQHVHGYRSKKRRGRGVKET